MEGAWYREDDVATRYSRRGVIEADAARCAAAVGRAGMFQCSNRRRSGSEWCGTHAPAARRRRRLQEEARLSEKLERSRAAARRRAADRLSWEEVSPVLCSCCREALEALRAAKANE